VGLWVVWHHYVGWAEMINAGGLCGGRGLVLVVVIGIISIAGLVGKDIQLSVGAGLSVAHISVVWSNFKLR